MQAKSGSLRETVTAILLDKTLDAARRCIQELDQEGSLYGAIRNPEFVAVKFKRAAISWMVLNKYPIKVDERPETLSLTELITFRRADSFVVVELSADESVDSDRDGTIEKITSEMNAVQYESFMTYWLQEAVITGRRKILTLEREASASIKVMAGAAKRGRK